ncbi:unnamed protein product [Rotaria sordida]|uniref:Uncharacterized protein n=1 Tax=Rotaria sordida TaxID=392033 RepID=A0A819MMZ7_9BILA|nr:unnamed protein product [Rotaria sordida]CAF3982076.1 unnamed protein product [Rotaria sordida]CAF4133037.1 unnamed protein product [Rotaria sordida]CAF4150641.1 unnamed protein product [Rotaria sordida]
MITLTDLALNSLGQSFNTNSKYDELLDKHRQHLLQSLPTNTPLKMIFLDNDDEENELHNNCDVEIKIALSDHFHFIKFVKCLSHFEELDLVYSVKGCEINFH